jgi:hypothetical protein
MTKWYDRVVRRLEVLDAQEQSDRDTFHWLFKELDDHQSRSDGEKVIRNDEGGATLLYKGTPVLSFSVRDSEITIVAPAGEAVSFTDREQALNKMADLMARALRNAPTGAAAIYAA